MDSLLYHNMGSRPASEDALWPVGDLRWPSGGLGHNLIVSYILCYNGNIDPMSSCDKTKSWQIGQLFSVELDGI